MKHYKSYWSIPSFALIGFLLSIVYCTLARPVYEVSGSIGIMRPSLPPVSNFMPETQNRWVWIRDGLSMKSMLLQDTLLHDVLNTSRQLKSRYEMFSKKFPNMEQEDLVANYINVMKKAIKIQYTGGDANVFIFTVVDTNPVLAKEIVSLLMSQLKSLYEEVMFKRNDVSLEELQIKAISIKHELGKERNDDMNSFLQRRINAAYEADAKLYVENILQTIQSKTLVKTINNPYIPTHPIWPRWDLIIFFSTFTGLLVGIVFYYIVSRIHE